MVMAHLRVLIRLEEDVEVCEVDVAFDAGLAAVEHHQDEHELCEFYRPPLFLVVEVLQDSMKHEVELILRVDHRITGNLDTNVLEEVESDLNYLIKRRIWIFGLLQS